VAVAGYVGVAVRRGLGGGQDVDGADGVVVAGDPAAGAVGQPGVRVHRVPAGPLRYPVPEQARRLAVAAQAERLVVEEFGDGERVVQFDHTQIRGGDPGLGVGLRGDPCGQRLAAQVRHGFGHTSQVSSSNDSDNPVAGLSELEVALLALLSIRPMTGYEILRHHARALEPWWETPRTQIYPKLRELQRRGLIEHEYVVQESKPNKRLYSIGPVGSEALASWLGSTINVPEMRHHMMMRLFLGNLLPIEETSRLLIGYRDRMAARAESYRQAKERFSRSLSGPYRASVFFELLSLDHLIAMTDLEVTGTDKALAALRRFGSDGALASAEQASDLLDAIRDVS
jgi:DNA-binding PadR family transcriptional regulator